MEIYAFERCVRFTRGWRRLYGSGTLVMKTSETTTLWSRYGVERFSFRQKVTAFLAANHETKGVDMRVLSVLSDDRIGGPHIRSLDVASGLQFHGVETTFLVPVGTGNFAATAREAGFKVLSATFGRLREPRKLLGNARFLFGFPGGVRRIGEVINDLEADLVHVNVSTNFQAAAAAARSDATFLWHFNDTLTPTPVRPFAGWAARRYADCVVVAADAVGSYYFPRGRTETETLYAPVDVDRFNPSTVSAGWPEGFLDREASPEGPIVGTVANINPAKGIEYFLQAVAEIRHEYDDVTAPIVGEHLDTQARYRRRLESLVTDLGLTDTVVFCGYRDDVPEVLATFDAFVLPSVAEACPVVILEAMAMEVPVVATDVGGVTEQLIDGEHGFVVPRRDSKALADRVLTVLDNPSSAEELGSAARRRVNERFAVEIVAKQTESVYRAAIGT